MSDESLIKTIDNQVEILTKSIQEGRALHLRDDRVAPNDGYENYETIVEAQVTDALQYEKKAAVDTLKALKQYILVEGL